MGSAPAGEGPVTAKAERVLIETYVANTKGYAFNVIVEDDDGRPVPLIDNVTKAQKISTEGERLYVTKSINFTNVVRDPNYGTRCIYNVYSYTPSNIVNRLKELHADGQTAVQTKEEWIKEKNPAQWEEIQARKALESDLENKYSGVITSQQGEIDRLNAEIAKLNGNLT